jgi:hypothetical protein
MDTEINEQKSRSIVTIFPRQNQVLIKAEGTTSVINVFNKTLPTDVTFKYTVAGMGGFVRDLELNNIVIIDGTEDSKRFIKKMDIPQNKSSLESIKSFYKMLPKDDLEKKYKDNEKVTFIEYFLIPDGFIIAVDHSQE